MGIRLNPFFKCVCGKLHVRTHVSRNTTCTCGQNLYVLKWK